MLPSHLENGQQNEQFNKTSVNYETQKYRIAIRNTHAGTLLASLRYKG